MEDLETGLAPVATPPSPSLGKDSGVHNVGTPISWTSSEAAADAMKHKDDHYSHRAPWLRAGVLGANDGLVSVASLMLGVGGGSNAKHVMLLAGVAGLVGGALSMAVGEYISVSSQRDAEEADIEKERQEQQKGPEAQKKELYELAKIYEDRGLSSHLALQVAEELTEKDVIRAHARDELGIDMDEMANPLQACLTSALAFTVGAGIPLLAAVFINDQAIRLISLALAATAALILFGAIGAWLGGAKAWKAGLRVLLGGWVAMAATYGIGKAVGSGSVS